MKWILFLILFLPLFTFAQMEPLEADRVPKYLYKWVPLEKIWRVTNNFLSRGHYPIHLAEFSEIVFHRPRLNLPETLRELNESPLLVSPEHGGVFFPRDHSLNPLALVKFRIDTTVNAQVIHTPLSAPIIADQIFDVKLVKHMHDRLFVEWIVTSPKAIIDFTADPKILVPEIEDLLSKQKNSENYIKEIMRTQPPDLWFNYFRSNLAISEILEVYKKNASKVPKYLRRPLTDCSALDL